MGQTLKKKNRLLFYTANDLHATMPMTETKYISNGITEYTYTAIFPKVFHVLVVVVVVIACFIYLFIQFFFTCCRSCCCFYLGHSKL